VLFEAKRFLLVAVFALLLFRGFSISERVNDSQILPHFIPPNLQSVFHVQINEAWLTVVWWLIKFLKNH
jgi:hypothetical protein